MLDFNEVFWHAEKRGKNAENAEKHAEKQGKREKHEKLRGKLRILKIFFADALRCGWRPRGRGALRTPISKRGCIALRTRIICPPLVDVFCCVADGVKSVALHCEWQIW